MKKYFAKYLPVKGEIKVGDYCMDTKGFVWQISEKDHMISHTWKKAKLFICSRDIQVGDKFFRYNETEEEECTSKVDNFIYVKSGARTIYTNAFKVIGELSPQAKWVKGGDEFDDDEIASSNEYEYECTCDPIDYNCYHLEDDRRGGDFCTRKRHYVEVKIKCKCCGTFK